MKKLIALLLALTMVLVLCACGNEGTPYVPPVSGSGNGTTPTGDATEPSEEVTEPTEPEAENELVGLWVGEYNVIDMLGIDEETFVEETGMDSELAELLMPKELMMEVTLEFTADGDYTCTMDMEKAMEKWAEKLSDELVVFFRQYLEESGVSEEDFEEEIGMTVEEYVQETMVENMPLDEEMAESFEGTYELEDDKLYLEGGSDYITVNIDGDELTLDSNEDLEDMEFITEIVFERQ